MNAHTTIVALVLQLAATADLSVLEGRQIVSTTERNILPYVTHHQLPTFTDMGESDTSKVGVIDVYFDAKTGAVIAAQVAEAPGKAYARALMESVSKWKIVNDWIGVDVVATSFTFYFITDHQGRVIVRPAL